MDCPETRDWLLNADDPQAAPGAVAEHVAACSACQSLAADLAQLRDAWRAIPLPQTADAARQAFLDRLDRPTLPLARPARRGWRLPRWAVAAAVLLGVGLAAWLLVPTPEAHAAPAVIEHLVDWNIAIAQAAPAERPQLFAAREKALREEVAKASLPEADRELANLLLENGTWLAANDDPVDAAERFSNVADKLVERMQSASDCKQTHLANRYARLQALVAEHGVAAPLKKAEETGALNFEHPGKVEKIILRDQKRRDDLIRLLEENPNLSRKEIRKALDIQPKNPRSGAKHNKAPLTTSPTGGPTRP